jgi:hypothetical protein
LANSLEKESDAHFMIDGQEIYLPDDFSIKLEYEQDENK